MDQVGCKTNLFIVLAIWFYNVEALTLKPLGIFWVFLGICGQINILTQFFKGGFLGICGWNWLFRHVLLRPLCYQLGGILSFDIHKRAVAGLVLWKSQMKMLERKRKLFSVFNFCLLVPFRQSWCTLRIRRSLLAIIFHLRSEGGKERNYDFAEMKSEMFLYDF